MTRTARNAPAARAARAVSDPPAATGLPAPLSIPRRGAYIQIVRWRPFTRTKWLTNWKRKLSSWAADVHGLLCRGCRDTSKEEGNAHQAWSAARKTEFHLRAHGSGYFDSNGYSHKSDRVSRFGSRYRARSRSQTGCCRGGNYFRQMRCDDRVTIPKSSLPRDSCILSGSGAQAALREGIATQRAVTAPNRITGLPGSRAAHGRYRQGRWHAPVRLNGSKVLPGRLCR